MSTLGPGSHSMVTLASLVPLLTSSISRKVAFHQYVCFKLMIQSSTSMDSEADGISELIVTHIEHRCLRSKCCYGTVRLNFLVSETSSEGGLECFVCVCVLCFT